MAATNEPDWLAVSRYIQAATGAPFLIDRYTPVGGGDIATCFHVSDGQCDFFVKQVARQQAAILHSEKRGLTRLREAEAVRIPRPVAIGESTDAAFLVLEYLPLHGIADEENLARQLAQLHRSSHSRFGGAEDNFLGHLPQSNRDHRDWAGFWRDERLWPQLERAFRSGYQDQLAARADRLLHRLPDLLGHLPVPSLLHGDLWHGNVGYLTGGIPVLFDPAIYFGDREADLAMAALFGGFGERFFAAYREAWPLPDGYRERRAVYQLYHLLNHLNQFGAGYLPRCVRVIERLL